jgi:hypothetical protein
MCTPSPLKRLSQSAFHVIASDPAFAGERGNPRSVASPEFFRDVAIPMRSLAALGTTLRVGLLRRCAPRNDRFETTSQRERAKYSQKFKAESLKYASFQHPTINFRL